MEITKLEKDAGFVAIDPKKLPKVDTVEEFMQHYFEHPNDFAGVDYEQRVKFLKDNGYKLTRANLIDPSLSVIPPKKK